MLKRESVGDVATKLAAIREASQYDYPAGDIESILAEIDRGSGTVGTDSVPSRIEPCKDH
jgi:hypothetical protein